MGKGRFFELPISNNFKHTSLYRIIDGKKNYIDSVQLNKDKFLGHRFVIHDEIYESKKARIRYATIHEDFKPEVSEWHYAKDGLIKETVVHYNMEEEISEE